MLQAAVVLGKSRRVEDDKVETVFYVVEVCRMDMKHVGMRRNLNWYTVEVFNPVRVLYIFLIDEVSAVRRVHHDDDEVLNAQCTDGKHDFLKVIKRSPLFRFITDKHRQAVD